MRKIFPFSFKGKNLKSVIFAAFLYTFIVVVVNFLFSFLSPLFNSSYHGLSTTMNLIRQFLLLWAVGGIVVSILYATDSFKTE
ncbi:MAG: hypothetical protein IJS44_00015 [Clostridia bacterium]|nr:hypothetical protein [Clostridia bacterium]